MISARHSRMHDTEMVILRQGADCKTSMQKNKIAPVVLFVFRTFNPQTLPRNYGAFRTWIQTLPFPICSNSGKLALFVVLYAVCFFTLLLDAELRPTPVGVPVGVQFSSIDRSKAQTALFAVVLQKNKTLM